MRRRKLLADDTIAITLSSAHTVAHAVTDADSDSVPRRRNDHHDYGEWRVSQNPDRACGLARDLREQRHADA